MHTISSTLLMVTSNMYMTKLDIKHTYYFIPIHEPHKKLLEFVHHDQLHKFIAKRMDILSAPENLRKLL